MQFQYCSSSRFAREIQIDRWSLPLAERRSKEHHNFLISLVYLPKVKGAGENIRVFVALTHYKYRDMHVGTF